MRRQLVVCVLLLLVPLAFWFDRNPENTTLDASIRAGATGRFVTLDEGITHFEIGGPDTGRVAVLVHGFSVPYYIWDSTFFALAAAGHRVIRYDLFGRGLSDRPDAAYDGAMFDAQLRGLLDSLGITQPVDLFGLSFGGFVTAHFTSTHPERVRTLVLVDPVTEGGQPSRAVTAPGVGAYLWQVQTVPTMADNQPSDFLHPEQFPGWADRYRPQMRFRGFGRALRRSLLANADVNYPAIYAKIAQGKTPVLLVWGKQDRTLPVRNSGNVTRMIPEAEFFPVDSSGHLPHLEQTALFNARVFAFLAAHPGAPPLSSALASAAHSPAERQ